jgi:predicted phosphodiesterase
MGRRKKLHRVGIIGDTHVPYHLDGYAQFCRDVFDDWDVDTVVHIGDLVDHHALSFHDSEPILKGANGELFDAREKLEEFYELFPKLYLVNGNHDLIPARQMKKIGMDPDEWLRPVGEVYGFPKGWEVVEDVVIDGVLYHHGYTSMGVNGFRNDSISRMQNCVSGHAHGNAGVSYTASEHRLIFGMAVGCGIDRKEMAFAYGKDFKHKPIVSCGVVIDGKFPIVETMDLGEN